MKEFLNLNHIVLMQISFLTMVAINAISIGYSVLGRKSIKSRYTILGNTSYMLFFFLVSIAIGVKIPGSHIIVAFLDLSAVILWMMGLNAATGIPQPKKVYLFWSLINVIAVSVTYNIFLKYSMIRSITSLIIVIVLVDAIVRFYSDQKTRSLDTFRFIEFTMVLFIGFKFGMVLYRWLSMQSESTLLRMSALSSVNILTFISLMFAIWINFAIVFVNYDILNNEMKALSLRDHLTKLPNRRMIMNKLEEFLEFHQREKMNFAIALIDLDDFKKVNDQYGHSIGDEVLVEFSNFLQEKIRSVDFVGRYGGEEFILILQVDDLKLAKVTLDRMMMDLRDTNLSSQKVKITMSGGVVLINQKSIVKNIGEMITLADNRLYVAKEQGKNRIIFSREE